MQSTKRNGVLVGPGRLTREQMLDGVPGPDGVRIGFAVPTDATSMTSLLKTAADGLEAGHLEALARGECGTWLLDGLAGADPAEPLVKAAASGGLRRAAGELSLPLVARDSHGQVIGALLGVPSGTIVSGLARLPGGQQQVLVSMLTYVKIKAVAVSEAARRHGIGAALLARCVQVYDQLEYTLLFGEFDTERDLGPFYRRQGFTVLRQGQSIDVGSQLTGTPLHLGTGPGLTLFYRRGHKR